MKCPNDQTVLAMMDRQGIEIDYCPTCRGVWLDRGELDKLMGQHGASAAPSQYKEDVMKSIRRDESLSHDDNSYHHKKRKESFLSELFDF